MQMQHDKLIVHSLVFILINGKAAFGSFKYRSHRNFLIYEKIHNVLLQFIELLTNLFLAQFSIFCTTLFSIHLFRKSRKNNEKQVFMQRCTSKCTCQSPINECYLLVPTAHHLKMCSSQSLSNLHTFLQQSKTAAMVHIPSSK